MITQELIDYVKSQRTSGVSREQITSDLLSQGGWTTEQVDEVFVHVNPPQQETAAPQQPETTPQDDSWERIKKYNRKTLQSAVTIFFVSVFIVTNGRFITRFDDLLSDSWVGEFVWLMLGVLLMFTLFVLFENKYLAKKYAHTYSKFDKPIESTIKLRNFIFILNVIPIIQIVGLLVLFYIGWLILIIYIILLLCRHKSASASPGI